ncbi:uncharacterized protein [Linepithema humile]|uniref:uncharacterized protein isoform X2 n=1 Tax=Linepithema humile TaxID=83485 RepID=UPI00351E3CA2
MSCLKTQYFSINRILLLMIGSWPYKQSTFVRLQLILLYSIVTSFIIFQFTAFVTSKFTPEIVIEIFSNTFFFILCMFQYNAFTFNLKINLLEILQHIYDELRDEGEVAIIEKYWIIARRYAVVLTVLASFGCIALLILPHIMYAVSLTNESQSFSLLIITEYFIDKERYSYLIVLHANAAICIVITAILATGSMIIMYFQHACGMFKIASYRIEQAMMKINLETNTKNTNMVYIGIVYAVDMHRKAMQFVNLLMSTINISMALFAVASVICASLNLFRIFQEVNCGFNIKKMSLPIVFLCAIYVYLFCANLMGQIIMDHNNDIFVTAYNVKWYVASLHIQRLILFLLQRGTKRFHLIIAGMFVGCFEGFATVKFILCINVFYVVYFNFTRKMSFITANDRINILLYRHLFYKPIYKVILYKIKKN